MAYDSMYNPYNQYSQQPMYQQPQRNSQQNQNFGGTFYWVSSLKEAEEYPLPPNGSVMLMNRNEKYFYLKACDGFGMVQYFKRFPYYEEVEETPASVASQPNVDYVSREEFTALKEELEALKSASSKEDKT